MLELMNIRKEYQSPTEDRRVVVLDDISLKVGEGQSMAITGASGSGKSTLLNIIGALDRPTAGRVLFDGTDLAELDDRGLAKMRNEQIGFIFQLHHLLPQCTVLENVLIPTLAGVKTTSRKEFEDRAVGLLERVGLGDWLYHRPAEISAGQRQRAAVVRALINKPKLLLADEPTGSLDAKASEKIAELLVELNQTENVTLLVVTHSSRLAEHMGQVLAIEKGKLVNMENQK